MTDAEYRERFDRSYTQEPTSGCWLWTGDLPIQDPRRTDGYGVFKYRRPDGSAGAGAHRASYEFHRGPIPDGMHVCHTCDVRSCVNPDHLFLSTNEGNLLDMKLKGRQSRVLTDDEVREIRRLYVPRSPTNGVHALGERFGVSGMSISKVVRRVSYKHIL